MCTNFGTKGQLAPVINEQWDKQFVKIFVFTSLCFENCQFCLSLLNTFAPTTGHWFFVHHFITFLKFSCCQLWMHLFFKWADSAIKSATTLVHQQCRVHQHWQTTHFKVHLYSPAEATAVSMVLLHWLFFYVLHNHQRLSQNCKPKAYANQTKNETVVISLASTLHHMLRYWLPKGCFIRELIGSFLW